MTSSIPIHHIPKSNANANANTNANANANVSSSTAQACAACKYQRRKCAPDCILAPFFPHDRQRQFLNAHKLFGVSNITKIIKNLDPFQKEQAMGTIIYQSDARAADPVGGCYRIVENLQRQLRNAQAELQFVNHQLAICKQQAAAAAAAAAIHGVGFDGIDQDHPFVDHQVSGFQQDHNHNHNHHHQDIVEIVWPGIHHDSNSNSSSAAAALSVHDFYDSTGHRLHQQNHLLKFQDPDLLHHSEEAMLKMENVMLNEDSDPIQQAEDQDQDLKGAVDSLFTFPTNTTTTTTSTSTATTP